MPELHFPWLEVSLLIPIIGSFLLGRMSDRFAARKWCLIFTGLTAATAIAAWQDFGLLHAPEADDRWHLFSYLIGQELLSIDQLNAPLLPMVSLLYFFTTLTTHRTKVRRFSFSWMLISEAMTLAVLCSHVPWFIILISSLSPIPLLLELRARNKPTGVFLFHMILFALLLNIGWIFVEVDSTNRVHSLYAILPVLIAILIRSGIAPFHCWTTDLFERATFGSATLFVTPLMGVYLAARLLLPIAPDWVLRSLGLLSIVTAIYTAGLSLVQKDGRRFYCYLFLSNSSLVLMGLESVNVLGLTGALCVWLTSALSLTGFGLALRAIEARSGTLAMSDFQGLYRTAPSLAVCFFITGISSIGFPGTAGFIGTELLVDGAVEVYPYTGIAVVFASALSGISMMRGAYLLFFAGRIHTSTVSLSIRPREQFAFLCLAAIIFLGGIFPHPGVISRFHAAETMLHHRMEHIGGESEESHPHKEKVHGE